MNNLELEIAELQKMIETKRDQLEREGGIYEEKELVREAVGEMLDHQISQSPNSTSPQLEAIKTSTPSSNASYLDCLDSSVLDKVNQLIVAVSVKGLGATVNQLVNQEPLIIDAFHDALVDKFYDELKARGFIK